MRLCIYADGMQRAGPASETMNSWRSYSQGVLCRR